MCINTTFMARSMDSVYLATVVLFVLFIGFIVEQIIMYTVLYSLWRKFIPVRCMGGMDEVVQENV
jgi:hypothetical protein